MILRGRGEERREERQTFGRGGDAVQYQMRQQLVSIGDDFWIENSRGERAFKVDGKALRVRQTLIFEDANGQELCKIQERMLRIKDSHGDRRPERRAPGDGQEGAHHAAARAVGPPTSAPGRTWTCRATSSTTSTRIEEGRTKVAEVSKKWFRLRDTYGVEIAPGQNDVLILAITVCVDTMAHGGR